MKKTALIWMALLLSFCGYAQDLILNPDNGIAGKKLTVTITGQNTHFQQGTGTTVHFDGGVVNSFQIISNVEIKASVTIDKSAYTGNYILWVYNDIDHAKSALFHIDGKPVPKLVSASPMSGDAGETLDVTITGTNTHFKKNKTDVYFFGFTQATATTTVINDLVLKAKIAIPSTTHTGNYTISVQNPTDGLLTLDGFHVNGVTPPNPKLTAITPAVARQGQGLNVTITGKDTHFDTLNGTKVWFHFSPGSSTISVYSSTPVSYTNLNANINIPIDAPLGEYTVEVKNYVDGSMLLPNAFTVLPALPQIISVNATNAKPGQTAGISVITTRTHYKTSKPNVRFDFNSSIINADTVIVSDDTLLHVAVTIPPGTSPGQYPLTISNAADGDLFGVLDVETDCPTHFTSTYDSISNSFTLLLDSITSTATSYFWSFGDGTYSSLPNPVHTFPNNQYYYVCLTASYANADSCIYCRVIGVDSTGQVATRLKGFNAKVELFKSAVTTGMPDIKTQASYILYPNPAKDAVNIFTQNSSGETTIRIYSVDGRLLKQQTLQKSTMEIDISDLKKGVYILQLTGNTKVETIKFIKE